MIKLFTTDTCPRCIPLKRIIKEENKNIEIVNLSYNDDRIEEYNITNVPALLIDGTLTTNIQDIVKIIKERE